MNDTIVFIGLLFFLVIAVLAIGFVIHNSPDVTAPEYVGSPTASPAVKSNSTGGVGMYISPSKGINIGIEVAPNIYLGFSDGEIDIGIGFGN